MHMQPSAMTSEELFHMQHIRILRHSPLTLSQSCRLVAFVSGADVSVNFLILWRVSAVSLSWKGYWKVEWKESVVCPRLGVGCVGWVTLDGQGSCNLWP